MTDVPLTDADRALLREPLLALAEREPKLPAHVYPRFFERTPEVRTLFGSYSQAAQGQMLDDTLVAILDLVDDARWLRGNLEALGSRHRHTYEVTPAMYDAWATAVVEGLAEVLGETFRDEHAAAARRALDRIHDMMLAGARQHRPPSIAPVDADESARSET